MKIPDFNKVLVLNSGSSSLKFKLFEIFKSDIVPISFGLCERIGDVASSLMKASLVERTGTVSTEAASKPMKDHTIALQYVNDFLKSHFSSSLASEVGIVAHRVVHGLDVSTPAIVDKQMENRIRKAAIVAPLHNPPNLMGIEAASKIYKSATQVAVFDTAFHTTIPEAASTYALPQDLCHKYSIKKYGFHGSSYAFVSSRASKHLGVPMKNMNAIMCHLGAGASICCLKNGVSVDTSMGFTPLEGLMMGTRCGDIDPGVILFLLKSGMDLSEVEKVLNKKSGFLGIAGSSDLREVLAGMEQGNKTCSLAVDVFVHRILRYMGSFAMNLEGKIDAIVFTGGIGEHSSLIRKRVCDQMSWLGLRIDDAKNESPEKSCEVTGVQELHSKSSSIPVLVIPTDEELSIAEQAFNHVSSLQKL